MQFTILPLFSNIWSVKDLCLCCLHGGKKINEYSQQIAHFTAPKVYKNYRSLLTKAYNQNAVY